MSNQRKAAAAILAAVAIMVVSAFVMAPPTARGADQGIDRLPGSWHVVASTPAQGSFPALFTFNADGGMIASESPGPVESSGHGNWERRGRDVAFTFFVLFGSNTGRNTGSAKAVGTLHFDASDGGWTGQFRIQVFNAAGVQIFTDTGTFELTRIEIESL